MRIYSQRLGVKNEFLCSVQRAKSIKCSSAFGTPNLNYDEICRYRRHRTIDK